MLRREKSKQKRQLEKSLIDLSSRMGAKSVASYEELIQQSNSLPPLYFLCISCSVYFYFYFNFLFIETNSLLFYLFLLFSPFLSMNCRSQPVPCASKTSKIQGNTPAPFFFVSSFFIRIFTIFLSILFFIFVLFS